MTLLLLATPLLPLLLALVLTSKRGSRLALPLAPWAALPGLLLGLLGLGTTLELPWLFLGTVLGLDETGRIFLLLGALLWLLAGHYARTYIKESRRRFFSFFLLTMLGNLTLPLAQDVVGFYLAFAVMTFAAFGLVVHPGTPEAARAGRVYLILAVIGEGLLLAGFFLSAWAAGDLSLAGVPAAVAASANRDLIVVLVLLGFGVKAGAWLLHVWLPLAHPVAPTPASAVLSGAIIKSGLLGWLRFLPLGEADLPAFGAAVMGAGLIAAYWGVISGMGQRDPKTLLAYSSISQMGLITVALGSGLFEGDAWQVVAPALLVYALHHAFAKGALFLGVGLSQAVLPRQRLLVLLGMLLPALALVGIPLTSGAIAKAALKEAVGSSPAAWAALMGWALPLAAVGTALLMLRLLALLWARPPGKGRLPVGLVLPWLLSLVTVGSGTLALSTVFALLPASHGAPLTVQKLWEGSWPLLLAALLCLGPRRSLPAIPAGDVLVLYERGYGTLARAWASLTEQGQARVTRGLSGLQAFQQGLSRRSSGLAKPAAALFTSWNTVGLALLLLALGLLAALGWGDAR